MTACTCWSQKYWFDEDQLRTIYQVALERDQFEEDNNTLEELVALNDSLYQASEKARTILGQQLALRTSQRDNNELKYQQAEQKFSIADETLKGMKLKKNIYIGTTIGAGVLALVLLLK